MTDRIGAQKFTCDGCGVGWERKAVRGQRPRWCPACRTRASSTDWSKFCPGCGRRGVRLDSTHCSRTCGVRTRACSPRYSRSRRQWLAQRRAEAAARGSRGRASWIAASCDVCGAKFLSKQPKARGCSPRCTKQGTARRRAAKYGWNESWRARCRRGGGTWELVHRRKVFERDGWTCYLCGRRVLRNAAVPNARAATIDHVIPLASGGDHSYANTRCAHFECNWRKADRPLGEQLMLVG